MASNYLEALSTIVYIVVCVLSSLKVELFPSTETYLRPSQPSRTIFASIVDLLYTLHPLLSMSPTDDYTVGWICAFEPEYVAAQLCLDVIHPKLDFHPSPHDTNTYTLGKISNHNVVIACLPDGSYGTSSAANVANNMLRSFSNVRIGLMVGIGGGAPTADHDIRLGDIVVGVPRGTMGGVFQYDFGKRIQEQDFQETGFLNRPPTALLTAVMQLKTKHRLKRGSLEMALDLILENQDEELREGLERPDASTDILYQSDFVHPRNEKSDCSETCGIDPVNVVSRPERTRRPRSPAVHYGLIASANQLMKDAVQRDKFARLRGVLCFETEAAGLMNNFPCLVIRGICHYSDSHKHKLWQDYAALAAAVYAKDLLAEISPTKVQAEKKLSELVENGKPWLVLWCLSETVKATGEAVISLIESTVVKNKDNKILDWLTPTRDSSQYSDLLKLRQRGTC
ncbi:vps9-ankyrin repeat-containing protein [Cordyceps javanica]|uniref:Vps9-ankyrin repeat-containing protein n=1 Tax=Cordyceps javanica TaxID=43265 RepID=A0A545WCY1_9HYPO|nr:vps9-ankyrin repeat-containing protein [Cordyceps javanica]TQW11833.1 vps9-ankyrin repeat-containing protein [Cordyceps javanica]